jgi:hypothetical protein
MPGLPKKKEEEEEENPEVRLMERPFEPNWSDLE